MPSWWSTNRCELCLTQAHTANALELVRLYYIEDTGNSVIVYRFIRSLYSFYEGGSVISVPVCHPPPRLPVQK